MTPDLALTLGDFEFSRLEIPQSINFGGEQRIAVHKLVGGKRVADAMGRDDDPVSWSGMILGENALQRAKYLDNLRVNGNTLILSYHEMFYKVIVQEFKAEFERFYKIPYRISLLVVEDLTSPVTDIAPDGIDYLIQDDMATANDYGGLFDDDELNALLGTLDEAIRQVSDFAKATQSVINSVLIPLAAVQKRVVILIGSVGNVLNNVTTLGGVLPNNPIAKSTSALISQVNAMNNLPQLYNLQSVLGRMSGNLGSIGGGGQVIPTAGGNLFSLASEYFGDATEWTTIARANDISDPTLTGLQNLKIPATADYADGVLNS